MSTPRRLESPFNAKHLLGGNSVINVNFHGVGTPERELEANEDIYWIAEDLFARLLDEFRNYPHVRLSFDDGNASDVDIALPMLQERSMTADFFVVADRFGGAGSLDDDAVRLLACSDMTVGLHGMHHRSWRAIDRRTLRAELRLARHRIEAAANAPVDLAACPLGDYDAAVLSELKRAGYSHVFTSDPRSARGRSWLQPRFTVRRTDSVQLWRDIVWGRRFVRDPMVALKGLVKRWR